MAPKNPPKVKTDDFLIAFGPDNTYLARAPNNISRSTLKVSGDLATKIEQSKGINFVVFPPQPQTAEEKEQADADPEPSDPYVSYSKKGHLGDSKLAIPSRNDLVELTSWLKDRWGSGGLQVVGNAHGAWWGPSSSGTTKSTTNLPREVRQYTKPYNPHGKLVHLALGVDNTYIVLFEDGHVDWDLKGQYDMLDEELTIRQQGEMVYASLSAYEPGEFFLAFKDGTVLYDFPEGADDLDEDFLVAESMRVITPSETAKHTGLPASKAPSAVADFTKGVMKDAAAKTIENALD